jgi:hypothetical protein
MRGVLRSELRRKSLRVERDLYASCNNSLHSLLIKLHDSGWVVISLVLYRCVKIDWGEHTMGEM